MRLLFVKNKITRIAQWKGTWYILTPATEQETARAIKSDDVFQRLGWKHYRVLNGRNVGGGTDFAWVPDRAMEFSCESDQIPLYLSELDPVFREPVLKLI